MTIRELLEELGIERNNPGVGYLEDTILESVKSSAQNKRSILSVTERLAERCGTTPKAYRQTVSRAAGKIIDTGKRQLLYKLFNGKFDTDAYGFILACIAYLREVNHVG